MIVTAALTTGSARVTRGIEDCTRLINEILSLNHQDWETTLHVGDVAFHQSKEGPYPNHEFRISVRPDAGIAACFYLDNDDPKLTAAYSWNPHELPQKVQLIFNGATGAVFPQGTAISIVDARAALLEWINSRRRPTCIEWRELDYKR